MNVIQELKEDIAANLSEKSWFKNFKLNMFKLNGSAFCSGTCVSLWAAAFYLICYLPTFYGYFSFLLVVLFFNIGIFNLIFNILEKVKTNNLIKETISGNLGKLIDYMLNKSNKNESLFEKIKSETLSNNEINQLKEFINNKYPEQFLNNVVYNHELREILYKNKSINYEYVFKLIELLEKEFDLFNLEKNILSKKEDIIDSTINDINKG